MARAKKVKEEVKEEIRTEEKPVDFGTGWTGKNNKIQYYLWEVKKNE